jgi:toxin-antitoxin system PIN domain toxin
MILVDANLLVYAYARDMPEHEAARAWLDDRLNRGDRVGLPWESLVAFVRLVTNPRVFERPATVAAAWGQVREWLDLPAVWIPQPTPQHCDILGRLLGQAPRGGGLVPDAHLAAIAIGHGLELCSTDGDFGRFGELRWRNPLSP